MRSKLNSLKEIPNLEYEGYLWMSDKDAPIENLEKIKEQLQSEELNPYIVEGLLYAQKEKISIMIRHTGKYNISQFDLNQVSSNDELTAGKSYFSNNKISAGKKLKFRQLWENEKDDNCACMEVLTLKATVFTGFDNP